MYGNYPTSNSSSPQPQGGNRSTIIGAIIVVVLLVLTGVGVALYQGSNSNNSASATGTSTSQSASPTTSTSTSVVTTTVKAAATECPDTTPLNFERKAPLDGNLVPVKDNSKHAVETDEDVQQSIKDNPKILAGWAKKIWPAKYPNSDNWQQFVTDNGNGKCLNEKGQETLSNVLAYLNADGTKVNENAQASPDLVNSFMDEAGVRSYAEGGITGDLSAVEYTLPNGKKVTVLKRCGNFADHGKSFPPGNPPPGATPTPPPPPPPTTEPPCIGCCPPGGCEPPPVCPPGTIGDYPNCIPVCTECCSPEDCPPTNTPKTETQAPGNGGAGDGGSGQYGPGPRPTTTKTESAEVTVVPVYTPAPSPQATATQAPQVTAAPVPTTAQTTAAPATEAPQTAEAATPTAEPSCDPLTNHLCG